jgi:cytoskeletal protein RodZ
MTSMSSKSPASSMSPMASTPMQPTPFQGTQTINANQTKKSANTLILGFVALVVIFLLAGGGYYWYMMMSSPAANAPQGSTQTNNAQNANQPASSFPSIVTKPSTNTAAPTTGTAKPTTTAAKPAKPTRVTTPFTEEQRSIISSYIGAHINEFAVPRSSRSYEVTDVTFDGPDRALVQYTNGTASYTAIAVASVDSSNNVRIVSFNLLEK